MSPKDPRPGPQFRVVTGNRGFGGGPTTACAKQPADGPIRRIAAEGIVQEVCFAPCEDGMGSGPPGKGHVPGNRNRAVVLLQRCQPAQPARNKLLRCVVRRKRQTTKTGGFGGRHQPATIAPSAVAADRSVQTIQCGLLPGHRPLRQRNSSLSRGKSERRGHRNRNWSFSSDAPRRSAETCRTRRLFSRVTKLSSCRQIARCQRKRTQRRRR